MLNTRLTPSQLETMKKIMIYKKSKDDELLEKLKKDFANIDKKYNVRDIFNYNFTFTLNNNIHIKFQLNVTWFPTIKFITPIKHPNVKDNILTSSIVNDLNVTKFTFSEIFEKILHLLQNPNEKYIVNEEAMKLYRENKRIFFKSIFHE